MTYLSPKRGLDVFIVVVALGLAIRSLVALSAGSEDLPPTPLSVGDVLKIRDIDWALSETNLAVLLSPQCSACRASTKFYRTLIQASRRSRKSSVYFLAETPPSGASAVTEWMLSEDLPTSNLRYLADPIAVGFVVTPTLVVVDSSGTVTDLMLRKLSSEEEAAVIGRLDGSTVQALDNSDYPREMSRAQFQQFKNGNPHVLLDVRQRAEFDESDEDILNIPQDELALRAPFELSDKGTIVVNCERLDVTYCRMVARTLQESGGYDVALLVPSRQN